jgi:hypothetical protein
MPSEFFTVDESAWLRGLSKDYEKFTASGGESAHYLQCLFDAFLKCFPYRHVRNVDHQSTDAIDRSQVIQAEDFGKVLEVSSPAGHTMSDIHLDQKLRHKMNYEKGRRGQVRAAKDQFRLGYRRPISFMKGSPLKYCSNQGSKSLATAWHSSHSINLPVLSITGHLLSSSKLAWGL